MSSTSIYALCRGCRASVPVELHAQQEQRRKQCLLTPKVKKCALQAVLSFINGQDLPTLARILGGILCGSMFDNVPH
jgi:hypothetical protein